MRFLILFLLSCSLLCASDRSLVFSYANEIDQTPCFGQCNEGSLDSPTSLTIGVAKQFYEWDSAQEQVNAISSGGTTCTTGTGINTRIEVGATGYGMFQIFYTGSVSGAINDVAVAAIFINGQRIIGSEAVGTLFQNDAILPLSSSGIAYLLPGDVLTLEFSIWNASGTLKIYVANMFAQRKGMSSNG